MIKHEHYMRRCFDLARRGAGHVSPNPMVGAVLVHEGRIIGEGWHRAYGQAHAEVNAVNSVPPADRHLICEATLYVSLEPCCIFGKTPPCTQLILAHEIARVVISCLDYTPAVKGQGVAMLRDAGVEVTTGVLASEGEALSAARRHFVTQPRPYVVLKYAQSADGFLAPAHAPYWISNAYARRLAHRWRAATDVMLVGTQTALADDPALSTRFGMGRSPIRAVIDKALRLPASLRLFDGTVPTLVFTSQPPPWPVLPSVEFVQITDSPRFLPDMLLALHQRPASTLLVEGGARLLQSFYDEGLWDEARVFTAPTVFGEGTAAPAHHHAPVGTYPLGTDKLEVFRREAY